MNFSDSVIVLVCLVAAASIMMATGIGAQFGGTPQPGAEDNVRDLNDSLHNDVESDQRGTDSIVGLAISAMSWAADLIGLVLMAPIALQNLGVPAALAIPLSLPIYAISAFFVIQVFRGVTVQ